MNFSNYSSELENVANEIDLKQSIQTKRKGIRKLRDILVFGKLSWQEALSFVSIIQSIVIFMALIPDAIKSLNSFIMWIHLPFQFPIELSSVLAFVFVVTVFIFGLIAVRHIGTLKRVNEIGTKMNPGFYLLWKKLEEIEKKMEERK